MIRYTIIRFMFYFDFSLYQISIVLTLEYV